jgi:hypothetical protein
MDRHEDLSGRARVGAIRHAVRVGRAAQGDSRSRELGIDHRVVSDANRGAAAHWLQPQLDEVGGVARILRGIRRICIAAGVIIDEILVQELA